ncbi:hypothetical protein MnTg03_00025 [bacterium MnTg03]|nr:hypothetical protein MnTg03_00025 [bacterium MnTg03]
MRDTTDARQLRGDFLGHQLTAEPRLGALRNINLQSIGAVHIVNVPTKPPPQHLEYKLFGGTALRIAHTAFAGVLGDARQAGCKPHGALGRCAERTVTHRCDHHRHTQLQRIGAVNPAELGVHLDFRNNINIPTGIGKIFFKCQVGQVWKFSRTAVTANTITTDLRFNMQIFLHLGVPVIGFTGKGEKWNTAHLMLAATVAQVLTGVDDFLKIAFERYFVAVEEFPDVVDFG